MLVILKVLKNVLKVVKFKGFEVWENIASYECLNILDS